MTPKITRILGEKGNLQNSWIPLPRNGEKILSLFSALFLQDKAAEIIGTPEVLMEMTDKTEWRPDKK